ncbi:hypothetical protein [Bifidobacterium magnum]|uniref:hypothetical protein n=1 Tax=Bifidobacterium magnum TaxID=1692 RepID=UPI0003B6427D|nr:hypothetical protein [Bifidobacterium magnum]
MITWIASTPDRRLMERDIAANGAASENGLALTGESLQQIQGFGGCFNELGYLAMERYLDEQSKETIFRELFSPDELNFTFNRAPVGARVWATGGPAGKTSNGRMNPGRNWILSKPNRNVATAPIRGLTPNTCSI